MKIVLLILGFLFGALAVWALLETFRSRRDFAAKKAPRDDPPAHADPQALIATDPYVAGNLRSGMRDTLPPGQSPG